MSWSTGLRGRLLLLIFELSDIRPLWSGRSARFTMLHDTVTARTFDVVNIAASSETEITPSKEHTMPIVNKFYNNHQPKASAYDLRNSRRRNSMNFHKNSG